MFCAVITHQNIITFTSWKTANLYCFIVLAEGGGCHLLALVGRGLGKKCHLIFSMAVCTAGATYGCLLGQGLSPGGEGGESWKNAEKTTGGWSGSFYSGRLLLVNIRITTNNMNICILTTLGLLSSKTSSL